MNPNDVPYDDAPATGVRQCDDKGRVLVSECSDRELLEELAVNMRVVSDVIEELGNSPMIAGMIGGNGGGMMAKLLG